MGKDNKTHEICCNQWQKKKKHMNREITGADEYWVQQGRGGRWQLG